MAVRASTVEEMELNARFWEGRRVLVTGNTGFKGSWLTLWLQSLGAEVTGYGGPPPSEPSMWALGRLGDTVAWAQGDVRDAARLGAHLEESRPEVIFHLAAQPLVRRSLRDPAATFETNVMGTVNLLEAVRNIAGVRVVVNVTTDKTYENRDWEWAYREDDRLGGSDPYSASKACSELVTAAYRASFFEAHEDGAELPAVATARAGNVIGGGDWGEDRLVPDLVQAALNGGKAYIRNPHAVRPWQHVLNPLSGYLALAQALWSSPGYADGWNFGPQERDARPVGEVAVRLAELWGGGLAWDADRSAQPPEAQTLRLDSSRARMRLGWTPAWDLDDALRAVVEWHRAVAGGRDAREVSFDQIREFTAHAGRSPQATVAAGREAQR